MAKRTKNISTPKIAKVKVKGKLDSLTDILKQRLFEYSPQSVEELVQEALGLLAGQTLIKIQKNVNRCLTKNPCFRSEGRGLWCLRLDGLKENDAVHRALQAQGDALRLNEINQKLSESGKLEIAGEQKLVTDGRFLRLKDGRWGLIHWAYIEPDSKEITEKNKEVAATASPSSGARGKSKSITRSQAQLTPKMSTGKLDNIPQADDLPLLGNSVLPLAKPTLFPQENNFWDKLFPLKNDNQKSLLPDGNETSLPEISPGEPSGWGEIAAGAETAAISLEPKEVTPHLKEFSLINGGKVSNHRLAEVKDEEKSRLLREIEELRRENKNLLGDLEKLHRRREEKRQELIQTEEQLVNLRVERDACKKRISHLETRLMQLQGTLNKTVSDAQAEQSRLKQQLREQEYRLQTTFIANEDLERTVADLQKERQELKRKLSLWPVRLALRLAALFGFRSTREKRRAKTYGRY